MNKKLFEEYIDLKGQISLLEAKMEELKPEVLKEVVESGQEEITIGDLGKLVLVPKKKWTYSERVKNLDAELKKAQKEEEAKGIATYTNNPYVRFDAVKAEEN